MSTDLLDVPHRREKQKSAVGTGTDITERKAVLLSPGDSLSFIMDVCESPCFLKHGSLSMMYSFHEAEFYLYSHWSGKAMFLLFRLKAVGLTTP